MPTLVMPECPENKERSDYVFHISGISRIKRTVASRHETPAQKTAGVTVEWTTGVTVDWTAGVTRWGRTVTSRHEMPDKREIYALKRIISLLSGMTRWGLVSLLSGMTGWGGMTSRGRRRCAAGVAPARA